MDLLLPLSLLGLVWERSGNPAGMVWILAIWCALKLLRWLPAQPVYGVLIGVLVATTGAEEDESGMGGFGDYGSIEFDAPSKTIMEAREHLA